MAGVNKVLLLGRLGRDPEERNFQNGGGVVNLRLATSERYKDRDGNQQERTEWHSVVIFDEKLREIAMKYLQKGSEVFVQGQLETRKYQDQSGQDRYSTEIVLRPFRGELALVGGRSEGGGTSSNDEDRSERSSGGGRSGGGRSNGWDRGGNSRGGSSKSDLDSDIPF